MTPDEIINKWIGGNLPGDGAEVRRTMIAILAGLKADIEQAITAAVEEKDRRIAELQAALRIFEDGANWEVYPGLRNLPIYEWRHDSDPRALAQDTHCNKSATEIYNTYEKLP